MSSISASSGVDTTSSPRTQRGVCPVALEIATQTSQMLEPCAGTQLSRPYTRSSLATTMDAPL